MDDLNFLFWLGDEAWAAREIVLSDMGGCVIENPDFTALFVPEIDLTDGQDELG